MPISVEDLNLPLRGAPGWDVGVRGALELLTESVNAQEVATNDAIDVISGAVDANDATIAASIEAGAATSEALDSYLSVVTVAGTGIDPTGVADSTTAVQAIIDGAAAGSVVRFPKGTFKLGAALVVSKALTLEGQNATLSQTGTGVAAITVTASDVTVRGLRLTGRQSASTVTGERAIDAYGASAASPILNLLIDGCLIDSWGQAGVWCQYVTGVSVRDCVVEDIRYAGLMFLSCVRGQVCDNTIDGVTGSPNVYGIAVTHLEVVDLATNPRSTDFLVSGNTVRDVAAWEGIDSHSAERLTVSYNTVEGCKIGISVVGSTIGANSYAPQNVTIVGNTVTGASSSGSAGNGIQLVGASASIGVPIELATGSIIGNTVTWMGADLAGQGGIVVYDTQGVVVSDNSVNECVPNGIVMYHDNYGFTLSGNTITDAWSDARPRALAILFRSSHNYGLVAGNVVVRGSRSATHVNSYSVEVVNITPNEIQFGGNRLSGFTLGAYLDAGALARADLDAAKVTVGRSGQQIGFYGVTTVARQAAAAAATDAATTQALANDLRSKLISLGLLS